MILANLKQPSMHSVALCCQRIAVSWVGTRQCIPFYVLCLQVVSASYVCVRGLHP